MTSKVETESIAGTTPATPHATANGSHREPADPASPSRRATRAPLLLGIVGVVVVLTAILGYRWYRFAIVHTSTDDAYVTSDVVDIAPQVPGSVATILVSDGQHVRAGDLVAIMDDSTFKAQLQEAEASLAVARAAVAGAQASVGLTSATAAAQMIEARGVSAGADVGVGAALANVRSAQAARTGADAALGASQQSLAGAQSNLASSLAKRRQAADAIDAAKAQAATAAAELSAAHAAVTAAGAEADRTRKDADRYAQLLREDAVSGQQADQAATAAVTAAAQYQAAQDNERRAQASVTEKTALVASSVSALAVADAAVQQARAGVGSARYSVQAARAASAQAAAQVAAAASAVHDSQAKRVQASGQVATAATGPRQVQVSATGAGSAAAKVLAAEAEVAAARLALDHTRLRAPVAGIVSRKQIEIGQQLAVGQAVMAVIPDNDIWVVANLKETQMPGVRVGASAVVDVDAVPGITFRGRVTDVSMATGATFALIPPDNATGNFTKVVQRVPVKVELDPGQPGLDQLRAGLSATVSIRTAR